MHTINKSILKISGADAATFLQGLITQDVVTMENDMSRYGALLTPQGKVVADFIIHKMDDAFYLNTWQGFAPELLKRFNFYKLRAQVVIEEVTSTSPLILGLDPRIHKIRDNNIKVDPPLKGEDEGNITHCLPQAGIDFTSNEVFPFEINMDTLNGISFTKGCYIGQEVVSRMHHKSTIRTRTVKVNSVTELTENTHEIYAGSIQIGTLGARIGTQGLARLRLDRVSEAVANNLPIMCGDVELKIEIPQYLK